MKFTEAYIGVKDCGCCVAVAVKGVSREHDMMIEDEYEENGYTISIVPLDEARDRLTECKHKEKQKAVDK